MNTKRTIWNASGRGMWVVACLLCGLPSFAAGADAKRMLRSDELAKILADMRAWGGTRSKSAIRAARSRSEPEPKPARPAVVAELVRAQVEQANAPTPPEAGSLTTSATGSEGAPQQPEDTGKASLPVAPSAPATELVRAQTERPDAPDVDAASRPAPPDRRAQVPSLEERVRAVADLVRDQAETPKAAAAGSVGSLTNSATKAHRAGVAEGEISPASHEEPESCVDRPPPVQPAVEEPVPDAPEPLIEAVALEVKTDSARPLQPATEPPAPADPEHIVETVEVPDQRTEPTAVAEPRTSTGAAPGVLLAQAMTGAAVRSTASAPAQKAPAKPAKPDQAPAPSQDASTNPPAKEAAPEAKPDAAKEATPEPPAKDAPPEVAAKPAATPRPTRKPIIMPESATRPKATKESTKIAKAPTSPLGALLNACLGTPKAKPVLDPKKMVKMEFHDADIATVVRALCQGAGRDFVLDSNAKGKVTAKLLNTTWDNALDVVLGSHGLEAEQKDGTLMIRPVSAQPADAAAAVADGASEAPACVECQEDGSLSIHARERSVRDLLGELSRAAKLNIVAAPDLTGTISLDLTSVSTQDALAAVATCAKVSFQPMGQMLYASATPVGLQTETFSLRYSEGKDVTTLLQETLPDAKVSSEATNNLLVITGAPELIAVARQIIERIEQPPVQVTIETRILETNLKNNEKVGIEWSENVKVTASTPEVPHTWPLHGNSKSKWHPGHDPSDSRSNGKSMVPFDVPDNFRFGLISSASLGMTLHMLKTDESTRLLANPVVTTVENKQASVNVVTKFPIAQYEVSSETGRLTISGFEYKEYGTILEVTPRVSDDHIILEVHPEISRQEGLTTFENAELPIIASQETTTEVRIKNGDTLVIAGLIREQVKKANRSVPYVSKIPLLGRAFRSKDNELGERRNMLIFITPRIVVPKDFVRARRLKQRRTEPMPDVEVEK